MVRNERYEGAKLTKRVSLEDRLREAGFSDVAKRLEQQDAPYVKAAEVMRARGCLFCVDTIVSILRARDEL
jgi:hypothetical protein